MNMASGFIRKPFLAINLILGLEIPIMSGIRRFPGNMQ